MTSTAPGAHPSPEEVDALLDPVGGDAHVGAHVAVCDRCSQVRDDLQQVRDLLGEQARSLPPEPPDLGAQIAAALAAEPPLSGRPSATVRPPGGTRDTGPGTVVSLDDRRRRPWVTWLAAAASVAVIGTGGTFLLGQLGQLGGGASDTSAGSAAEAPAVAPQDSSGGAGSDGEELGNAPVAPSVQDTAEGTASASRSAQLRASGTDYDRTDLAAQAQALLVRQDVSAPDRDPLSDPGSDPGSEPGSVQGYDVADQTALAACLVAVGRPGVEPVVTDLATFQGQDAAVVVIADRDGYEVLVVPAGCGAGQDRVLASARLR